MTTTNQPRQHEHQVITGVPTAGPVKLNVCIEPGCDHTTADLPGIGTFAPGDPVAYTSPPWWYDKSTDSMQMAYDEPPLERVGEFVCYDAEISRVMLVDPEWGDGYIGWGNVRKPEGLTH